MELQTIQNKIYEIRGRRVMLDFDLAQLYRVETRVLKQAGRRNIERFPEDFMLRLSQREANELIVSGVSQFVIPSGYNIGSSQMFAFTEHGVAMLSSVLRNETAINININIIRAFVAMRNYLTTISAVTAELAEIRTKIALLERNDELLAGKDEQLQRENEETLGAVNDLSEDVRREIADLYAAIGALSVKCPAPPRRKIGYRTTDE